MKKHHRPDPLNQAREFWSTIVLRKWGILFASFVLAAIAVVTIKLMPDSYSASTSVLFDPQKLPDRYIAPTVTSDPAQRLNTLTQEVLSTGRLLQIGQDLHLFQDSQSSPQEFVDQMRKQITIEMKPSPEHEMSAFAITYSGRDPKLVAAVANRLAQSFIDWDLANREQQAASTKEFMVAQLQDAKHTLDVEEEKINDYKQKHSGQLPEQLQSNMQALQTMRVALQANTEALERLEQEKTMLTALPETSRTAANGTSERDRLESERRTLQAELTQYRSLYTEQYPDVITTKERLDAVKKQLSAMDAGTTSTPASSSQVRLQVIAGQTERLQEEQKKLLDRISKYQAQVDATALRGQELAFLSRNYNSAKEQYDSMLDKSFHAEMAMELEHQQKTSRFTVDPAQVPTKPLKPNRMLLLALSLPLCALLPAAVAVGANELRGTVNSERALRELIPEAARVVGHIPWIETVTSVRRRRQLAMLSILGSLVCCAGVALFISQGVAERLRPNRPHEVVSINPKLNVSVQ